MTQLYMTEEAIVTDYRQAKQKNKQIGILADLNQCKRSDIVEILQRHGEQLPGYYKPSAQPDPEKPEEAEPDPEPHEPEPEAPQPLDLDQLSMLIVEASVRDYLAGACSAEIAINRCAGVIHLRRAIGRGQ